MKVLIAVTFIAVMAGCANQVPLAQLEAEALLSGDWTAVERRERAIAHRRGNRLRCSSGYVAVCTEYGPDRRCQCIEQAGFRSLLSGRPW